MSSTNDTQLLPIDVASDSQIDWSFWMQSWDDQQRGYLPDREARFDAMFEVLDALLPPDFTALDLACGPGSISQRLIERFPRARCVAVDLDPVLLAIGRHTLGDMDGRLQWLDVDLCDPAWTDVFGDQMFDAVLSTTALHWLAAPDLVRVYRQVAQKMNPGGVFLNGDNMRFEPGMEAFRKVSETVRDRTWAEESFAAMGVQNWEQWWDEMEAESEMESLFAERKRRFAWREDNDWINAIYATHKAALYEAGFREVDTIWQNIDNRIIMGVK